MPLHQVPGRGQGLVFSGGGRGPPHTSQSPGPHQPADLIATGLPVCPAHHMMHFPHPIDPVVRCVQLVDFLAQDLIANRTSGFGVACGSAIYTRSDEPTICLGKHSADGLDSETIEFRGKKPTRPAGFRLPGVAQRCRV